MRLVAMSMSMGCARWLAAAALASAGLAGGPAAATPVGNSGIAGPAYVANGVAFEIDIASNLVYTPDGHGVSDADLPDGLGSIELPSGPGSPERAHPETVSLAVEFEYDVGALGGAPLSFPSATLRRIRMWIDGVEYSSLGPTPSVEAKPDSLEYIVHVMDDARFANGALLSITGDLRTYEHIAQFDFAASALSLPQTVGTLDANVRLSAIAAPVPVPLPLVGLITGLGAMALLRGHRAA